MFEPGCPKILVFFLLRGLAPFLVPSYNTPPCEAPMSLRFPIALVLSLVCLATPVWAGIDAGKEAFDRGDYATAFRE